MSQITKPIVLDETLQRVADALEKMGEQNIANQLTKLENDFDDVFDDVTSINIFNPETAERGYFYKYNSSTSTMGQSENVNMACVKQAIEGGKVYTCSRIDYIVYFLTSDGTKTGSNLNTSATGLQSFTFETPSDASYVCLSWNITKLAETRYMIVEGNELPTKYIGYSEPYKIIKDTVKINSNSIIEEIYTVALDGSGDYTSFSGCLLDLKDNTNPKTIYVKAGTYDVFEEIGGADFCATIESGTNWRDCSVLVPDNTKIIGVGMVELVFRPTLEQIGEVAGYLLSPINVKYNAEFENIFVNSCNCRYAIHSDGRENDANPIRQVYRNVRIKHQRIDIGNAAGFGAGTANGNNYIFENCNFEAWTPLSFHNNGSWEVDGTQIILKNCVFKTTLPSIYPSLNFGNVNPKQTRIDVRLNSCYLNGNINIKNETSSAERPNAFAIEALNCSSFDVNCTCETNIYTPVILGDDSSLITTLVDNKAEKNVVANALKGTASGQSVVLDDISPVEHSVGVNVKNKNIVSAVDYRTASASGIAVNISMNIKKEKFYIVSFDTKNTGATLWIALSTDYRIPVSGQLVSKTCDGTKQTFIFQAKNDFNLSGISFIQVNSSSPVGVTKGDIYNLMVEEGTVATDYADYVADISNVGVEVWGNDGNTVVYYPNTEGVCENITSIYPMMYINPLDNGALVDITYNRDTNKAFAELEEKLKNIETNLTNAIISTGGNV